jgi:magnesium transporter
VPRPGRAAGRCDGEGGLKQQAAIGWRTLTRIDVWRLAAPAAMIALPTMIAGVSGIKFPDMPERSAPFGDEVGLAEMALAWIVLFAGFKRAGWL